MQTPVALLTAAAPLLLKPSTAFTYQANSAVEIGMVGCGGRGVYIGGFFLQDPNTRIVAVADVFDALMQQRPYKNAWPLGEAFAEVERQRGRQFDPAVAEAFLRAMDTKRVLVR